MLSEARLKKIAEKLDGAQNAQFWGLKTWGQRGGGGSQSAFVLGLPFDVHLASTPHEFSDYSVQ